MQDLSSSRGCPVSLFILGKLLITIVGEDKTAEVKKGENATFQPSVQTSWTLATTHLPYTA